MTGRRDLIALLGGAVVARPMPARAAPGRRGRRVEDCSAIGADRLSHFRR